MKKKQPNFIYSLNGPIYTILFNLWNRANFFGVWLCLLVSIFPKKKLSFTSVLVKNWHFSFWIKFKSWFSSTIVEIQNFKIRRKCELLNFLKKNYPINLGFLKIPVSKMSVNLKLFIFSGPLPILFENGYPIVKKKINIRLCYSYYRAKA